MQDCRYEIAEAFANARTRLDDQMMAIAQCFLNGMGHRHLFIAMLVVLDAASNAAART